MKKNIIQILLFTFVLSFTLFINSTFAAINEVSSSGTILSAPTNNSSMPALIIFPGMGEANGDWIVNEIPDKIKKVYIIAIAAKSNTNFQTIIEDLISFASTKRINISSTSLVGFSAGALKVQRNYSQKYKLVGLIDPSTNDVLASHEYGENTVMIYRWKNWGEEFNSIKTALPVLAAKINNNGGSATEIEDPKNKYPQYTSNSNMHLNFPKIFFNEFIDIQSTNTSGSENSQTTKTKSISDYLTSNPTDELQRGVINAGGLPSIEHLSDERGQIYNTLGIQGGQYLVSFIIISLLQLIGVFALIGIMYNAFMLVLNPGEDEKRDKAGLGLKWSLIGLILVIVANLIVTVIVQLLSSGNTF